MRNDPVLLIGFGILLFGGIFAAYPAVLLIIPAVAAMWWIGSTTDKRCVARLQRDRELREAADREHALVLAGDPAGVYGNYPPEATS